MKSVYPALITAALLLSGCASSGSSSPSEGSWWNPFAKVSWSSLSPLNWFGSSLEVNEQGVGAINGSTAMNASAIDKGLDGNYTLRQGMRTSDGNVVSFWQALDDGKVKLVINGNSTVTSVEVTDEAVASSDGAKIGSTFSERYSKAFGACQKAAGLDSSAVECKAPDSQHISYIYSGDWHGPEGLMPSDDTLKNWKLSKIIWRS
ncbi:RpoE-regulated lipoprotein [Erwiniaceae bacterium BAC15a-03b]|uniref:RpoE-regulated lipoprotein n=1 Tax=Winslowiella arboricola TaxID=2978220 RepID=A0A9J6PFZ4_9GAMM|nr:RpoE-regulated lipoprotein [Winslowiella arboricola]MCU5771097.1 RpoE-regulated lipoprotein [Winslowiella arboricola]MCU5777217.1 RpoE-regulated lipoprotein [Winslowiella arboricola]